MRWKRITAAAPMALSRPGRASMNSDTVPHPWMRMERAVLRAGNTGTSIKLVRPAG